MRYLKEEKIPSAKGLNNTGVICYFNSLLQTLSSCTSLIDELQQIETKNELIKTLQQYIEDLNGDKQVFQWSSSILRALVAQLARNNKRLTFGSGQESASECFILMLEMLNCKQIYSLFNNKYENMVVCQSCKKIVATETNIIPQINLFANVKITTPEQFASHICTNKSEISGYKCEKCGKSNAIHLHQYRSAPEIIVVMLNKYFHKTNRWFPFEFELPSFTKSLKYRIIAQVEHFGSLNSGHYMARVQKKDGVYLCNDINVSKSQFMHTSNTYMIFYHIYQ